MQQQPVNMSAQQQNQQPIMPVPPSVITTKDQLYISDMLSWNLLAMKKAHFFAKQCQDVEIKQTLESTGRMHQQHYQRILAYLQPNQHQTMSIQ